MNKKIYVIMLLVATIVSCQKASHSSVQQAPNGTIARGPMPSQPYYPPPTIPIVYQPPRPLVQPISIMQAPLPDVELRQTPTPVETTTVISTPQPTTIIRTLPSPPPVALEPANIPTQRLEFSGPVHMAGGNTQPAPNVPWVSGGSAPTVLGLCGGGCAKEVIEGTEECAPITIEQPMNARIKKYTLLLVPDTSDSMDLTREVVAKKVGDFIMRLPPHSQVDIGVIAAHGPDSSDRLEGVLFSESSKTTRRPTEDPKVLHYPQMSLAEISKRVVRKMTILQKYRDDSSAQGEMGLMSIFRAVTDAQDLPQLKSEGLLEPGSALGVIFMSDEQDVCYDYKANECPQFNGKCEQDPIEIKAKSQYCHIDKYAANSRNITPQDVLSALQSATGGPLVISGVHYLSNESIPKTDKTDKFGLEHEMGHGYLDLIQLSKGFPVDLAKHAQISDNMMRIADFSNYKMMDYTKTLRIHNGDESRIALETVVVSIIDSSGHEEILDRRGLQYDPSGSVTISDRVLFGKVKPGSKLKLTYRRH